MELKVYLAEIGMTLKDFSTLLGYAPNYLSNVHGGKYTPGKKLIKEVLEITDGAVDWTPRRSKCADIK